MGTTMHRARSGRQAQLAALADQYRFQNLTRARTTQSKTRGAWGELTLSRPREERLVSPDNYTLQATGTLRSRLASGFARKRHSASLRARFVAGPAWRHCARRRRHQARAVGECAALERKHGHPSSTPLPGRLPACWAWRSPSSSTKLEREHSAALRRARSTGFGEVNTTLEPTAWNHTFAFGHKPCGASTTCPTAPKPDRSQADIGRVNPRAPRSMASGSQGHRRRPSTSAGGAAGFGLRRRRPARLPAQPASVARNAVLMPRSRQDGCGSALRLPRAPPRARPPPWPLPSHDGLPELPRRPPCPNAAK